MTIPSEEHEPGNYGYCKKCGHSVFNGEPCPNTKSMTNPQTTSEWADKIRKRMVESEGRDTETVIEIVQQEISQAEQREKKKRNALQRLTNKYARQISLMADGVPYEEAERQVGLTPTESTKKPL